MNEPIYEQMQQLIQQIRQADTAYYKHDTPIMSDLEYDRLMDDLVALEEHSGVILSHSPTQHVAGETLETLAEVRHTKPMLSAAKTKSVDNLIRFAADRDVLLSWKMDGLTLVLRYENGHLKQAITRGRDGIIGEDVTHTVKTFLNVPLTIPISEAFEVRGEGVISWKNFDTINAELDDAYSHPRNLAAGSVRKLDASEAQKRMLEFWAFDLVSDSMEPGSKHAQQQLLASCASRRPSNVSARRRTSRRRWPILRTRRSSPVRSCPSTAASSSLERGCHAKHDWGEKSPPQRLGSPLWGSWRTAPERGL